MRTELEMKAIKMLRKLGIRPTQEQIDLVAKQIHDLEYAAFSAGWDWWTENDRPAWKE